MLPSLASPSLQMCRYLHDETLEVATALGDDLQSYIPSHADANAPRKVGYIERTLASVFSQQYWRKQEEKEDFLRLPSARIAVGQRTLSSHVSCRSRYW